VHSIFYKFKKLFSQAKFHIKIRSNKWIFSDFKTYRTTVIVILPYVKFLQSHPPITETFRFCFIVYFYNLFLEFIVKHKWIIFTEGTCCLVVRQKTHDQEVLGSNPRWGEHFSWTIHLDQIMKTNWITWHC